MRLLLLPAALEHFAFRGMHLVLTGVGRFRKWWRLLSHISIHFGHYELRLRRLVGMKIIPIA